MEQTQQETIMALEELTKSFAASIERLDLEIAGINDEIKNGLLADTAYQQIDEQIKTLQKQRKVIKEEAMARQNLIAQQQKVKDLKRSRKEKKLDLSEYLLELQRQGGVQQLTLLDGREYIIKKSAKLQRKPKQEYTQSKKDSQSNGAQLDILHGSGA